MYITCRLKFEFCLDGIDVIRFALFPNVVTKPPTMNLMLKVNKRPYIFAISLKSIIF